MIVVYALGAFMSWNNIAYVGILPPAGAFLLLLKSPESPVYLIMKGEMERAEHSLKRLSPHKDVSIKIQSILESSNKAKDSTGKFFFFFFSPCLSFPRCFAFLSSHPCWA